LIIPIILFSLNHLSFDLFCHKNCPQPSAHRVDDWPVEAMIVQLAGELVIGLVVDVQNGRRARLDGRQRETLFVK
jgi:hypothetical protein